MFLVDAETPHETQVLVTATSARERNGVSSTHLRLASPLPVLGRLARMTLLLLSACRVGTYIRLPVAAIAAAFRGVRRACGLVEQSDESRTTIALSARGVHGVRVCYRERLPPRHVIYYSPRPEPDRCGLGRRIGNTLGNTVWHCRVDRTCGRSVTGDQVHTNATKPRLGVI